MEDGSEFGATILAAAIIYLPATISGYDYDF